MKFEYKLNKDDFLIFQLFTASKSVLVSKKRRKNKIIIPIIYIIFGILFFIMNNIFLGSLFLILTVLWYVFYPAYESKRFRKYYQKYILENYSESFERFSSIIIDSENVFISDNNNESKIKLSEIIEINEIKDYIFLKFKTGSSLILPKNKIQDLQAFNTLINSLKNELSIEYKYEPDWQWK